MNLIQPKKLLLSKWTAMEIVAKQKHFIVTKLVEPMDPDQPPELIEIEAVYSKAVRQIPWRDLCDDSQWQRGWK
ncbi:TIGR02450 family Trp-rich protein [Undibacterium jejuense]|uniref:TIGR02450 family Trp-rich protein n=1 Tax=Undibacterium jejuense TaxID=1344949 RepID=A0A923HMS9_9BURK|nr:TIGR02450 family Trp-rich protein [Undibacterium jejuense]